MNRRTVRCPEGMLPGLCVVPGCPHAEANPGSADAPRACPACGEVQPAVRALRALGTDLCGRCYYLPHLVEDRKIALHTWPSHLKPPSGWAKKVRKREREHAVRECPEGILTGDEAGNLEVSARKRSA